MTEYTVVLNVNGNPMDHTFNASRFYIDPGNNNLFFYDDREEINNPLAVIKSEHWVTVERKYAV